jgi:hypothetical protein
MDTSGIGLLICIFIQYHGAGRMEQAHPQHWKQASRHNGGMERLIGLLAEGI